MDVTWMLYESHTSLVPNTRHTIEEHHWASQPPLRVKKES